MQMSYSTNTCTIHNHYSTLCHSSCPRAPPRVDEELCVLCGSRSDPVRKQVDCVTIVHLCHQAATSCNVTLHHVPRSGSYRRVRSGANRPDDARVGVSERRFCEGLQRFRWVLHNIQESGGRERWVLIALWDICFFATAGTPMLKDRGTNMFKSVTRPMDSCAAAF